MRSIADEPVTPAGPLPDPPKPAPAIGSLALLEALEGVAYLTAPDGTILAVGRRGWSTAAADDGVPWLDPDAVIGTSLFDTIRGATVRAAWRRLHATVAEGRRTCVVFDYRCDTPVRERHMRMSISAVVADEAVQAVLYQSQLVAEAARIPVPLFNRQVRDRRGSAGPIVLLCSMCQLVWWPGVVGSMRHQWMTPEMYYRCGGPDSPAIDDVVCPRCERRMLASTG